MRKITFIILVVLWFQPASGQNIYADFSATIGAFYRAETGIETDRLWEDLVSSHSIPLVAHDSVAFFYRGAARSVTWMGDFNGWGNSRTFNSNGSRIPESDIWILKASLPLDARLDYKILLNGKHYILDPANPFNQWSGVGGGSLNSELRMPAWREDTLATQRFEEAIPGQIARDLVFNSLSLGYQITYSVYTPPHYQADIAYPVVYVTDGYEYMHERMGGMIAVLDNLIYLKKIPPMVAVFIDHRDPINRSVNRRMRELAMNEKYLEFVTNELIPAVEEEYKIRGDRFKRAIIGTSQGGLSATWFAFSRPDLFGMAGIQSPAFWFKPEIYTFCKEAEDQPLRIFMTTGLIHDAEDGARKMKKILDRRNCPNELETVNQGHSWGNWKGLLDDMLVYLFAAEPERN